MALTPLATTKVTVSTTAASVAKYSGGASPTKAVIFNAGPSLVFVKMQYTGDPAAVVDQDFPIPAGQTQELSYSPSMSGLSIVGAGSAVAYVTFAGGDLNGVSSLAASAS